MVFTLLRNTLNTVKIVVVYLLLGVVLRGRIRTKSIIFSINSHGCVDVRYGDNGKMKC